MEQKNNSSISIILESLGEKGEPRIWMRKEPDGSFSLPLVSEQKLIGFDLLPIFEGKNIFVRSSLLSEGSRETMTLFTLSEAWVYSRNSCKTDNASAIESAARELNSLGVHTGIDRVIPLSEGKSLLLERELTFTAKLLLFTIGAWLAGKFIKLKLRGTDAQATALGRALLSSKKFQDELKRPGASIDSVMSKLNAKNMDAQRFERTFGIKWPV
jgi:hypothetical protein